MFRLHYPSLLSFCLLWLFSPSAMAAVTEERKAEIVALLSRDTLANVDLYQPEEKEFIREWCNEAERNNLQLDGHYHGYLKQLLQAGDPKAMDWLMEQDKGGDFGTVLRYLSESRQPLLIVRVVDGMFVQESAARAHNDTLSPPKSVGYAYGICKIVAESHEFPTKVRDWARRLNLDGDETDDLATFRDIMRKWFTANKTALEKQDWRVVSVGEFFPVQQVPKRNTGNLVGTEARREGPTSKIKTNPIAAEAGAGGRSGAADSVGTWKKWALVAAGVAALIGWRFWRCAGK